MADPANQETPAKSEEGQQPSGGTSGEDIGLTMLYIISVPGILKIVEFVCTFKKSLFKPGKGFMKPCRSYI